MAARLISDAELAALIRQEQETGPELVAWHRAGTAFGSVSGSLAPRVPDGPTGELPASLAPNVPSSPDRGEPPAS
jgi:hypothetical protein